MAESVARHGLTVRFWGVRGSLPAPGPETLHYGGNTACVEARFDGKLLILDAGSGLRALGDALARGPDVEAEVFCSHAHLDHVCGLPFFTPLYTPGARLRFWGAPQGAPGGLESGLAATLSGPLMPDLLPRVRAELAFVEFQPGDVLTPWPGLRVATAGLRHPGGAVGYRLEWQGKTVAYVTDTEHDASAPDREILRLADRADILIYDATYTDAEFPEHRHWGHSTWQEGVRLANLAGAGQLVLFHHAPSRTDSELERIEAAAGALRPGTLAAREGLELSA